KFTVDYARTKVGAVCAAGPAPPRRRDRRWAPIANRGGTSYNNARTKAHNLPHTRPHAMTDYDFDLLVIGSGPAGQRAAIQAAKLDKRVAIVERKAVVGGVCINTGTIPSKTLREAVLHLSGYR